MAFSISGVVRPRPPGSGSPTVPPPSGRNGSVPPPATPGAATVWPIAITVNRPTLRLTAMRRDPWVLESPYYATAGESLPFTFTYEGASSVTDPVAAAYKDETTVTSTVFPTNSPSVSANVVTLSTATGLVGGERYVIAVTAVVDGATLIRKLLLIVAGAGAE